MLFWQSILLSQKQYFSWDSFSRCKGTYFLHILVVSCARPENWPKNRPSRSNGPRLWLVDLHIYKGWFTPRKTYSDSFFCPFAQAISKQSHIQSWRRREFQSLEVCLNTKMSSKKMSSKSLCVCCLEYIFQVFHDFQGRWEPCYR